MKDMAARAGPGLRLIFSYCDGFSPNTDLLRWMKDREYRPSAYYANWRGRTVRQCREEEGLRQALVNYIRNQPELTGDSPRQVRDRLRQFVDSEKAAGRIMLTPEQPTPLRWRVRNTLHAILAAPAIILVGIPFAIYVLFQLRGHEKSDPEVAPRPDPAHVTELARIEDHGVTNQFTAMGSLKPGLFRRWASMFLLWAIEYTTRHIYVRGRLARVATIHFARWVFLDNKKRMVFFSNYDGSLDSYMDDFINKAGFGLNAIFSNAIGYPRTNWLVRDGCADEQKYRNFLRRHTLPTQVWYKAYPGLTAQDLARNSRIRNGFEKTTMSDDEIRRWVAEI